MNKYTEIINAALNNIEKQDAEYANRTFAQRLPGGFGSIFEGFKTREELEQAVRSANWVKATHPDIMPGCQGYVTNDIPGGHYGMIRVEKQADDALFAVEDPKNTGKVSLGKSGRSAGWNTVS